MTDEVQAAFCSYVERVVNGISRALFRTKKAEIMNDRSVFTNYMHLWVCKYLNDCYQSVLVKDDLVVLQDYQPFCSHSPVCLFNLMRSFIVLVLSKLDFESLRWHSLDQFSLSFTLNWRVVSNATSRAFSTKFCTH